MSNKFFFSTDIRKLLLSPLFCAKIVFYFSHILSSALLIYLIPINQAKLFLSVYALCSIIFGIWVYLSFSKSKNLILITNWSSLFLGLLCLFNLSDYYLFIIYTLLVVVCEYSTSILKKSLVSSLYRIAMSTSVILAFFGLYSFITLINLRIGMSLLFIFIFLNAGSFALLRLRSPFSYVIGNYFFYYIPLLLISTLKLNPEIKLVYITYQIIASLYLKTQDFIIRGDMFFLRNKLHYISRTGLIIAPVIIFYVGNFKFAIIGFLGFLGLVWIEKKCM